MATWSLIVIFIKELLYGKPVSIEVTLYLRFYLRVFVYIVCSCYFIRLMNLSRLHCIENTSSIMSQHLAFIISAQNCVVSRISSFVPVKGSRPKPTNLCLATSRRVSPNPRLRCSLSEDPEETITEIESEFEGMEDSIDFDEEVEFSPEIPLINSVQLTGNLGADPILKHIREGLEVCTFSMAVRHEWDPNADPDDGTSWFDVEAWGSLGRFVSSKMRKGFRVGVTGSINVSKWTGRDGTVSYSPIVTADTVELLQSRSEVTSPPQNSSNTYRRESSNTGQYSGGKYGGIQVEGNLSDLPF